VIDPLQRTGRPITEILSEARQRNVTATLDDNFGEDLEDIIAERSRQSVADFIESILRSV